MFRISHLCASAVYEYPGAAEKKRRFNEIYQALSPHKQRIVDYILNKDRHQKHRLHVVSPSPWPIYSASAAFLFVLGMILWMHGYTSTPLLCGFLALLSAFFFWFRDIIREGVYMGYHTKIVQACLRLGFVLFLVSEVMFFFGFFWALLHFTLTPSIFSGGIWPPQGIVLYFLSENVNFPRSINTDLIKAQTPMLIRENHASTTLYYDRTDLEQAIRSQYFPENIKRPNKFYDVDNIKSSIFAKFFVFQVRPSAALYDGVSKIFINLYSPGVLINPYKVPLLNTAILLTSGFVLTLSHSYLRTEYFLPSFRSINITILMGLGFILLQGFEYTFSGFSINDGVYGSIFYMLTGFHGFHVIVGTIFLFVCSCRMWASHFTSSNHFAFEAAAWYWHFVDVVWILLYLLLYLWPNARYFAKNSSIFVEPHHSAIYINMTTDYFFKLCSPDPDFNFRADINFEYDYPAKTKVVTSIINHFQNEILNLEKRNKVTFWDEYVFRFRLLSKKLHR